VFPRLADHNLKQLLEAGLCVTVNSDDPAYFGGYLNENFVQLAQALELNAQHAYQLARNSFEASFVGEERKREYIAQLDAVFAAF
jgi:adenine deaminase